MTKLVVLIILCAEVASKEEKCSDNCWCKESEESKKLAYVYCDLEEITESSITLTITDNGTNVQKFSDKFFEETLSKAGLTDITKIQLKLRIISSQVTDLPAIPSDFENCFMELERNLNLKLDLSVQGENVGQIYFKKEAAKEIVNLGGVGSIIWMEETNPPEEDLEKFNNLPNLSSFITRKLTKLPCLTGNPKLHIVYLIEGEYADIDECFLLGYPDNHIFFLILKKVYLGKIIENFFSNRNVTLQLQETSIAAIEDNCLGYHDRVPRRVMLTSETEIHDWLNGRCNKFWNPTLAEVCTKNYYGGGTPCGGCSCSAQYDGQMGYSYCPLKEKYPGEEKQSWEILIEGSEVDASTLKEHFLAESFRRFRLEIDLSQISLYLSIIGTTLERLPMSDWKISKLILTVENNQELVLNLGNVQANKVHATFLGMSPVKSSESLNLNKVTSIVIDGWNDTSNHFNKKFGELPKLKSIRLKNIQNLPELQDNPKLEFVHVMGGEYETLGNLLAKNSAKKINLLLDKTIIHELSSQDAWLSLTNKVTISFSDSTVFRMTGHPLGFGSGLKVGSIDGVPMKIEGEDEFLNGECEFFAMESIRKLCLMNYYEEKAELPENGENNEEEE